MAVDVGPRLRRATWQLGQVQKGAGNNSAAAVQRKRTSVDGWLVRDYFKTVNGRLVVGVWWLEAHVAGDGLGVLSQIVQAVPKSEIHSPIIQSRVLMHEQVSEACHLLKPGRQVAADDSCFTEDSEHIAIVGGRPELLECYQRVPHVERGFERQVQDTLGRAPSHAIGEILLKSRLA